MLNTLPHFQNHTRTILLANPQMMCPFRRGRLRNFIVASIYSQIHSFFRSNITDASAKKSRSRSNLQGFQIEQKKSSEETPFLNRLHAEVTASMSQSSRTSFEFAKNANMDSTVSAPKPAIPALLSPASLNRQTRQKSKTNTNESAVSIVPAQDATSDISRSTRNSRPLQIHSAMPTNVQATTKTAQTSRRAEEIKISGTKSRRHDEVIRTARTRIRLRKSNISNIYGCERRSRRGIVAIMEEEDDSIDPDIGFCLLSSGLQSSPDSDVGRANSEEPLCLPLWIQSSLEKGSWCKPGKVVGLYMDGEYQLSCDGEMTIIIAYY